MDWLNNLIKNNAHIAVSIPSIISACSFVGNVAHALSDGAIDSAEFHQLMAQANGLEMIILVVIMLALRKKT